MDVDIFKEVLVPVIGGLGIFMLGLEFMANGIQALAVNKMRAFLARAAGTPIKGASPPARSSPGSFNRAPQ
jgi:phosphate:Na+ symporter